jgi:Mn2+/Fe2+ NRAMP family transporter
VPTAFRRDAAVLLAGLAAIAAATDLLRDIPHISTTTVALVLLLIVLTAWRCAARSARP